MIPFSVEGIDGSFTNLHENVNDHRDRGGRRLRVARENENFFD